jgi:ATP-dependent exoDNAse (exonuclease V) beta subunit
MIIQKFPYEKLNRTNADGSRKYITPDGSKLSSVTTILDATKPEEVKEALNNWRKRVGHAKATEITTGAASVGTRMHKYLEQFVESDALAIPGSIPLAKLANNMAQVVIDKGLCHVAEVYGSEVSLFYPGLYAGTTDLVALYKGDLAICDFKQSLKPKKSEWIESYRLQLAAYILAHDELYGTSIKQGVILMCSQDLTFQSWEVTGNELEACKDEWWRRVEKFYLG